MPSPNIREQETDALHEMAYFMSFGATSCVTRERSHRGLHEMSTGKLRSRTWLKAHSLDG